MRSSMVYMGVVYADQDKVAQIGVRFKLTLR